jgi:HlyD family secretion protein
MATLEAEVDVSESNIAELKRGQPAEVSVEAFPDHIYRAALREAIPTADRTKATITVKVTILDKDRNLTPEMSAKVTFLERSKNESSPTQGSKAIITVPKVAVVVRNGASVVFEVNDRKRVHIIPVQIAAENNGLVTVAQGLVGSEVLVCHPPDNLRDGDLVRPSS